MSEQGARRKVLDVAIYAAEGILEGLKVVTDRARRLIERLEDLRDG